MSDNGKLLITIDHKANSKLNCLNTTTIYLTVGQHKVLINSCIKYIWLLTINVDVLQWNTMK